MEVRTKFAVDDIVEYRNRPARVTEVNLIEDVINRVNYFIEFDNDEGYSVKDVELNLIRKNGNKPFVDLEPLEIGKYYIAEIFKHGHGLQHIIVKLISIDTDLMENGKTDKERVTYKGIVEFVNGERKYMTLTGCEPLSNIDDYFPDCESLRENINEWMEKGIYLYKNSSLMLMLIKHLFHFRRYGKLVL